MEALCSRWTVLISSLVWSGNPFYSSHMCIKHTIFLLLFVLLEACWCEVRAQHLHFVGYFLINIAFRLFSVKQSRFWLNIIKWHSNKITKYLFKDGLCPSANNRQTLIPGTWVKEPYASYKELQKRAKRLNSFDYGSVIYFYAKTILS